MIQQPTTYIEKRTVTIEVDYNEWHNTICQMQAHFLHKLTKVKLLENTCILSANKNVRT